MLSCSLQRGIVLVLTAVALILPTTVTPLGLFVAAVNNLHQL